MKAGWIFFVVCAILAISFVARLRNRFYSSDLVITFFDVAQGDAALVQFPGGKTMLVDAGGGFGDWDIGGRELLSELSRLGVLELDIAFLTHPDRDHAYGFQGVLEGLTVSELWWNGNFHPISETPLLATLLKIAIVTQVKSRPFFQTTQFHWGGVEVEVSLSRIRTEKTNNRSLLLFLRYGGCDVLFTGDIERPVEEELTRRQLPKIDLLKVAHHGSLTSSNREFLRMARPLWSVISVGLRNPYGHPRPEVVARLKNVGSEVFRTDFHGFVRFRISPTGEAKCETSLGDCGTGQCLP